MTASRGTTLPRLKPDMHDTRSIRRAGLLALRPPPNVTISEWADKHRVLTSSQSALPGPWSTERVPYMREPMDALSPNSPVKVVVFMKGARVAYTEGLVNTPVGAFMHMAPCPIMVVQPSEGDAEEWSKDSLDPMLATSGVLRGLVSADTARKKGNTILHKHYRGGVIYVVSASTPKSFRRRLARLVLCDEVDGYPGALEGEGDPTKLAAKRAATYTWSKKIVYGSTPTIKGSSRIERLFESSDQRYYHVPCPDCAHMQPLVWERMQWTPGQPHTAEYACASCGSCIPHYKAEAMRAAGRWVPTHPERETRGYHISALYSPWVSWSELVSEWEDAQGDPSSEQVFTNTVLGLPWDARNAEKWDDDGLRLLVAPQALVPARAVVLTASIDVQGDRLALKIDAWAAGRERWTLSRRDLMGDPSAPDVWAEALAAIVTRYPVEGGGSMRIRATCVDTGGQHTQAAWDFCRRNKKRGVHGIKGQGGPGKRLWPKEQKFRSKGVYSPVMLGVDTGKEATHAQLRRSIEMARAGKCDGPGFWHFAEGQVPDTHLNEIVSEARVVDYGRSKKGSTERKARWVLREAKRRNEGLDLSVYSYAALQSLLSSGSVDLDRAPKASHEPPDGRFVQVGVSVSRVATDEIDISARAANLPKRVETPKPTPATTSPPAPQPPPRPQKRPRPRVATHL